nr:glycosyltransferase [uncultured Flavobacterium sp.]
MISIIICSRTQTIKSDLSENIKNTIGCDYELIVIDNSENQYSIFEAYNEGIKKSTGEYLCLIHDDIFIHTNGWGNVILRIFGENRQIGLIGIAGAKIKTKMPSAWWDCPDDQKVIHIIQHFRNGEIKKQNFGFKNDSIQEVVAIDGIFMAMQKDKKIHFSTEINGYHSYDLNISFEYNKNGYKIMVTNEILIEHFSIGIINDAWVASTYKIHNFYKGILPLSIKKNKVNRNLEQTNAIRFIEECLKYKQDKKAITIWRALFLMHPISKYHYTFWKRIVKNKLC